MELITATNQELVELLKALQNVKAVKSTRFALFAAKNLKELERVLLPIEEKAVPSLEFQKVSAQAHKLAEAEDEEGIKKLEEDNYELIEQRKSQIKEVEELMQNKSEVYLHLFNQSQLPEDLTADQVLPLLAIIKE